MAAPSKLKEFFLGPGEYLVSNADYRIRTLLGSCVSITLWHPHRRIGAMSHFLLPTRGAKHSRALDGRYGDEALALMLQALEQRSVPPSECQAKIFGGGNMFPRHCRMEGENVGRKNGESARRLLGSLCIPIVSESLFGVGHRQVFFETNSGEVWARQVKLVESELPNSKVAA